MLTLDFAAEAKLFLTQLFSDLKVAGVELAAHWDIDHLCYRADTEDAYQELKAFFKNLGEELVESEVNGRLIATYKLHAPVFFQDWRIDLVELPAPKKGKTIARGLEHIEVVCDIPFAELMRRYPQGPWETKGLTKDFNQELELNLGERNVKFHHASLESVIAVEKNTAVWNALQNSQVLHSLKSARPLVAGTFPLQLATQNSDVDILLYSVDHKALEQRLRKLYGSCAGFQCRTLTIDSLTTIVCEFTWEQVHFEIFAQAEEPVHQKGYRHFLIEERLLKWGGKNLRSKVLALRHSGLKTEAAFAAALGLSGNPYVELLEWQGLATPKLKAHFS